MKVIIKFPEDVEKFLHTFGIVAQENDGSYYFHFDRWIKKETSGIYYVVEYKELPDTIKNIQLKYINQPERFTLDDMKDAFDAGSVYRSQDITGMKTPSKSEYFKEKFNIDINQ